MSDLQQCSYGAQSLTIIFDSLNSRLMKADFTWLFRKQLTLAMQDIEKLGPSNFVK